jgi:transcription elongation factor Elf1
MGTVVQHFRCFACDNDEIVTMAEEKAAMCSATVVCGGCGEKMVMVSETREDDDGTEDGIPFGPITFLDL